MKLHLNKYCEQCDDCDHQEWEGTYPLVRHKDYEYNPCGNCEYRDLDDKEE